MPESKCEICKAKYDYGNNVLQIHKNGKIYIVCQRCYNDI